MPGFPLAYFQFNNPEGDFSMKWFMKRFNLVPYVPPVPGRSGRSVWDELVEEWGEPPVGHYPVAEAMPDWAAA